MGSYIEDKWSSVSSNCWELVSEYYSEESPQFQMRKDQKAIFGMMFGVVGIFCLYVGASSFGSLSAVPALLLGAGLMFVARRSVKDGFDR